MGYGIEELAREFVLEYLTSPPEFAYVTEFVDHYIGISDVDTGEGFYGRIHQEVIDILDTLAQRYEDEDN